MPRMSWCSRTLTWVKHDRLDPETPTGALVRVGQSTLMYVVPLRLKFMFSNEAWILDLG